MNIHRVVLDVDKARARPSLVELGAALESVHGVEAVNITVTEIDLETVGMDVTVEGADIDYEGLNKAVESAGAVVNSIDELACGQRLIGRTARVR